MNPYELDQTPSTDHVEVEEPVVECVTLLSDTISLTSWNVGTTGE